MFDTSQVPPEQSFNLARQLQAQGRLAEAQAVYEKLLKKLPNHPQSLTMMASICYQGGEDLQAEAYVDRAIEVYEENLERTPNNVGFKASLMTLLLARGAREKAEHQALDLDLPINAVRAGPREFFERSRSGAERGIPLLLINTVPKSASESIWNKLAEGLGIGASVGGKASSEKGLANSFPGEYISGSCSIAGEKNRSGRQGHLSNPCRNRPCSVAVNERELVTEGFANVGTLEEIPPNIRHLLTRENFAAQHAKSDIYLAVAKWE